MKDRRRYRVAEGQTGVGERKRDRGEKEKDRNGDRVREKATEKKRDSGGLQFGYN